MSNGIVSNAAASPATRPGGAPSAGTLLLSRGDVERLLAPDECIAAVEDAFRRHALGAAPPPGILGMHVQDGSFHVKAAQLTLDRPYLAAKLNANFPHNGPRHGLPTIQGVVVLCEAENGVPLAVMDSSRYFIEREMVRPGTFVAGVGADNENKQELEPRLLAESTLVADLIEQCAAIGDLHHALAAGVMSRTDVHAELGEIVAGRKPGRTSDDEITVFDSSGTALQDVAAAIAVYRRALEHGAGVFFSFDA